MASSRSMQALSLRIVALFLLQDVLRLYKALLRAATLGQSTPVPLLQPAAGSQAPLPFNFAAVVAEAPSLEDDAAAPDAQLVVRPDGSQHAALGPSVRQTLARVQLQLGRSVHAGPAAGPRESARVLGTASVTPAAGRLGAPGGRKVGVCNRNTPGRLPAGQPLAQAEALPMRMLCLLRVLQKPSGAPALAWKRKPQESHSIRAESQGYRGRRLSATVQAQRRSSPDQLDDMQLQLLRSALAPGRQPAGADYVAAGAAPDQDGQQQHITLTAATEASLSEALTTWQLRSLQRRFAAQRERSAQGRPRDCSADASPAVLDMSGALLGAGEVPVLAALLAAEGTCAGLSLRGCMLGSVGLHALLAALAGDSGCPAGAHAGAAQLFFMPAQSGEVL